MLRPEQKEFLTISYTFYNFGISKVQEKKIKLYSEEGRGKDKKEYISPTYEDIYFQNLRVPLLPKKFTKNLGLKIYKELTAEEKEVYKESIRKQDEIIEIIRKRDQKFNYNCGMIKLSTGAGKSVLCTKIMEYYDMNTLILVNNVKLLHEMIERIEEWTGLIPAQYGDGKKEVDCITICTKTSFSNDYEEICKQEKFDLIIIDEMHSGFTDNLRLAINKSFNQIALYGMSGTTYTQELQQEDLEKYFGKIIEVSDSYNYIPEFEIISYKTKERLLFEDYAELRTLLAEDKQRFERQIEKLKELYMQRQCILILTDRITEANNFYERLEVGKDKFDLIKLTGETDPEDDKKNLENALNSGKKKIIIGSIKKVGVGFDYKAIDTVFLVSAIKFSSTVIQAIGRALRKAEKLHPKIIIWDDESLKGQSVEKLKIIKEEYGVKKENIKFIDINDSDEFNKKTTLNFNILENGRT